MQPSAPYCALPLALLATPLAHATELALLGEGAFFHPLPSVTAATRLEQQQRDLPAPVTLIDRAMIEASGAVNIADLLRLVPGFQVYHVNGNKFGVVSHGQGDEHPGRLEVTLDGRSVYSPLLSSVDWNSLGIDLDDIAFIEVVRGPNVPTHGSNAFLGSVHIHTREPLAERGTTLTAETGDRQHRLIHLRHHGELGPLQQRLSLQYRENDGFKQGYAGSDPSDPAGPQPMNDGGQVGSFNWRADFTPSLNDSLELLAGYSDGRFGVGNAAEPDEIHPQALRSHFQQLVWTRTSDNQRLKLNAYHNYLRWDHNFPFEVPANGLGFAHPGFELDIGVQEGRTERYDIELEHSLQASDQVRLVSGLGYRWESLQSDPLLRNNDTLDKETLRAFGNLEWRPSARWTLNAGAMWESDQISGSHLSPRLALNHHLDRHHSLRLAASKAYRTPSLLEQNMWIQVELPDIAPFNGPPFTSLPYDITKYSPAALQEEQATNYEAGWLIRSDSGNASLDLRLYVEELEHVVDDVRVNYGAGFDLADNIAFENRNVDGWRTKGAELQWRYAITERWWSHLAYAYADTDGSFDRGFGRGTFERDDLTPQHTLSALTDYALTARLHVGAAYYHLSGMVWRSGSRLPHYNRLDLRAAYRLFEGDRRGQVELILQNIGDDYTEFEQNNEFETRAYLRFRLDFI
ncbi:TonB-dependent receptor plug domain-containing protein [Motiliproteus sediminis]|uniref:TonB-dependent receptor plug domain-containing protein n=1 Tax=Motiliproteus sediminis TaxID=1468178 RepID=UPI001AEF6127|nr:TonB-dependent receptor [Motiliproteus sediminis]